MGDLAVSSLQPTDQQYNKLRIFLPLKVIQIQYNVHRAMEVAIIAKNSLNMIKRVIYFY